MGLSLLRHSNRQEMAQLLFFPVCLPKDCVLLSGLLFHAPGWVLKIDSFLYKPGYDPLRWKLSTYVEAYESPRNAERDCCVLCHSTPGFFHRLGSRSKDERTIWLANDWGHPTAHVLLNLFCHRKSLQTSQNDHRQVL